MNKGVLIDTCMWIDFFKSNSKAGDVIEELIKSGSAWICGIVLYELAGGIRAEAEKHQVMDALANLKFADPSRAGWFHSGELAASLKKTGLNLPMSDIIIAATAIDHDLSVFSIDKHFTRIPGLVLHKP